MNTRLWTAIGLIIGAALLGGLIYGSLSSVQETCELCVEFRGQRQCRRGSGATEEDAQRAAVRAACGVMAFGMEQSIACERTPPRNVSCGL